MMHWIIGQSIKFRVLVLIGAAALMFIGVSGFRGPSVDVLPEFSPTYVEVQTEALGLAAAEVEQLITVPLEADLLNGVAWLHSIRSESVNGLSSIVLVFEPGTEPMQARQVVNERLTQAHALPNVSKPPVMLEPLSSASRVMMVGLTPKELSLIDTSVLAQWTIRPRLMGVHGVANVAVWGLRDQQMQVQVDPQRLAANDVSLAQVIHTTGNAMWVSPLSFLEASTPGTGGFIDTTNQRLSIQHVSPIVSPETLAQVTVEDTPGRVLRLGDVANVVKDHQPLIGDAANGNRPSLLLVVEKLPGANTLEVTRSVESALETLKPGLQGIQIDTGVFREASFIEEAVQNVGWWLLIGSVLMVVAIGLLLFEWRTALISIASVLVSLTAAVIVLVWTGSTVNAMLLAGLVGAVALVVDDAIIDADRIRRKPRRKDGDDTEATTLTFATVIKASLEARGSIIFASAITLLAVVPVFFLGGQQREFYRPLALAYVLTVAASMVVALTLIPALSAILLTTGRPARRESALLARLHGRYERVLSLIVHRRRRVLAVTLVLLALGIGAVPLLTATTVPTHKNRDVLIKFDGPPGTSLSEMDRITTQVSIELRTVAGVRNVGAHVGRAVLADQVVGVNSSQLWVSIDPGADYDRTLGTISNVVHGYPGITSDVLTYEKARTADILGESANDITVRIFGQDIEVLRAKAQEVNQILAGIDGIVNPRVEAQIEEPTIQLEVNLAAAERFGIKPGDVRRASATLLSGTEVGSLFEEQKVFGVVVQGTPAMKHSLSSVRDLLIESPSGTRVRLGDVATVKVVAKPNVIQRDDVSRRIDISANVQGRAVGSVSTDVQNRLKSIAFPLEYHAELLGSHAQQQSSFWRTLSIAIAAALGIFLLLQAAFRSWRLAAVVFPSLAIALLGGVVATVIGGGVFSVGSLVGLLVVFGIAARNSVMLIRHYQRLEEDEGEEFGHGLVLRGTQERIGPVLVTTVASAVFFLPVLFFGDIAGLEIVQPMALAVIGGLVTSTFFTLVVVPLLYLAFGSERAERVLAD
jgi:CzcA family heavy metal efflux pump